MKKNRRIWALLLSLAMIFTLLPATVFAADQVSDVPKIPEPVKVVYSGPDLRGVLDTDTLYNLETPDVNRFIVTYSDGSKKTFIYREKTYKDENSDTGEEYTLGAFIPENVSDPDPLEATECLYAEVKQSSGKTYSFKKGWNESVELAVYVQYPIPGGASEEGGIEYKTLSTYVDVLCAADSYPRKVEFIPAEGFIPECTDGYNYLADEIFYGEGNKFIVSYEGWMEGDPGKGIEEGFQDFTTTYVYAKGIDPDGDEVEGFFVNGNVTRKSFAIGEGAVVDIAYNKEAKAKFTYIEYVDAYDKYVEVPFEVTVKATRREPYANYPVLNYTGKPVTVNTLKSKIKVYDANGKVIPASTYDIEAENEVEMGWYDAKIVFNDSLPEKDTYVDSITTFYGIGPAAPAILNPVAGKKSMTVKWKKPTASQLKNIDGFYIELSTDKQFNGNYKRVNVKKDAVKKGKKVIKGLKKGKKYYVRLYAYKTVKQNDEKFKMWSDYSKVKYKKTK